MDKRYTVLARIKQLLAPPIFEDEEKTRVATLLNTILLIFIAVTLVASLSMQFIAAIPNGWRIGATIISVILGLRYMVHRGQVKFASFILCLGVWTGTTLDTLTLGGEVTVAGSAYSFVILLAGLLLGGWAGIVYAGLSVFLWLNILIFEVDLTMFTQVVSARPAESAQILGSVYLILLAVVLHLATRSITDALEQARYKEQSLRIEVAERERAEVALERYAAKLEQSNNELQDFAYVASHDLQEPLRKIRVFGDRLQAKYGEALGDQGRDYLTRMQNASTRMQVLINGLLTYSRVTTQSQPFTPVDLTEIVREVLSDLEVHIEQAKGRVEICRLPVIEADPTQMRQLFQNLISNALKFHRDEVPPVVKINNHISGNSRQAGAADEVPAGYCQIAVEDNGIGFEEKYTEQIFQVFQRLHSRNNYEGTGIGLATCRKITERHGGTITAKSVLGSGTTIIITLPLEQQIGDK